jgi:hypothetical protein
MYRSDLLGPFPPATRDVQPRTARPEEQAGCQGADQGAGSPRGLGGGVLVGFDWGDCCVVVCHAVEVGCTRSVIDGLFVVLT